jgi:hypothetical protein
MYDTMLGLYWGLLTRRRPSKLPAVGWESTAAIVQLQCDEGKKELAGWSKCGVSRLRDGKKLSSEPTRRM